MGCGGAHFLSEVEIGRLAETTGQDLDGFIGASRAQAGWASLRPEERALAMEAVADRLLASQDRLALLESLDSGNPLRACRRRRRALRPLHPALGSHRPHRHGEKIPRGA